MPVLFRTRPSFWHRNWRSTSALSDNMADASATDPCMICHVPVGNQTPDGEIESWSVLPCSHRFGSHCVKRWLGLTEQPACPICRTPMVHSCGHPVLPLPFVLGEKDQARKTEINEESDGTIVKKMTYMSPSPDANAGSPPDAVAMAQHEANDMGGRSRSSSGSSGSSSSSDMDVDDNNNNNNNNAAAATSSTKHSAARALARFRRKRRLSFPGPSSVPIRTMPDTRTPCDYCSLQLVKKEYPDGPPGGVVRLAVRAFTHARNLSSSSSGSNESYGHGHGQNNQENAYWERWRKDHSSDFAQWWATQEPPTEPACVLPTQGWVGGY